MVDKVRNAEKAYEIKWNGMGPYAPETLKAFAEQRERSMTRHF